MPVINVAMHKVGEEMKTTLIRELTNVAAEVTKIPARPVHDSYR